MMESSAAVYVALLSPYQYGLVFLCISGALMLRRVNCNAALIVSQNPSNAAHLQQRCTFNSERLPWISKLKN